jgi:hypothetical protein
LGACTGVRSISAPCEPKTSSNLWVNFRVPIAQHNAEPGSLLLQHQQQVTSLLGDPGGVGVGGHSGQVDPPGVQFDEEQHIQPPQRGGVDGEEVARRDSRGLLAEERSPSGGGPPRCRIQAVAVQRGADRGGRDSHAEVHQFALDALVAQRGFSVARRMISCWTTWSSCGRPWPIRG